MKKMLFILSLFVGSTLMHASAPSSSSAAANAAGGLPVAQQVQRFKLAVKMAWHKGPKPMKIVLHKSGTQNAAAQQFAENFNLENPDWICTYTPNQSLFISSREEAKKIEEARHAKEKTDKNDVVSLIAKK